MQINIQNSWVPKFLKLKIPYCGNNGSSNNRLNSNQMHSNNNAPGDPRNFKNLK